MNGAIICQPRRLWRSSTSSLGSRPRGAKPKSLTHLVPIIFFLEASPCFVAALTLQPPCHRSSPTLSGFALTDHVFGLAPREHAAVAAPIICTFGSLRCFCARFVQASDGQTHQFCSVACCPPWQLNASHLLRLHAIAAAVSCRCLVTRLDHVGFELAGTLKKDCPTTADTHRLSHMTNVPRGTLWSAYSRIAKMRSMSAWL